MSKLVDKVKEVIKECYGTFPVVEELALKELNPNYSHNYYYDLAIPKLRIVFECHGIQHYEAQSFGNKDYEDVISKFKGTKDRDSFKKEVALQAGWTYVVIPYTLGKTLTSEWLWDLYKEALREQQPYSDVVEKKLTDEIKKKNKAFRKEQYKRNKEWKNAKRLT